MTACQSGVVSVWKSEDPVSFNVIQSEVSQMGKLKRKHEDMDEETREKHSIKLGEGKEVCRMRQNPWSPGQVIPCYDWSIQTNACS